MGQAMETPLVPPPPLPVVPPAEEEADTAQPVAAEPEEVFSLEKFMGVKLFAWLGGVAVVNTGSYAWMWYADIALALGAAVVNLPIEEAPLSARTAAA